MCSCLSPGLDLSRSGVRIRGLGSNGGVLEYLISFYPSDLGLGIGRARAIRLPRRFLRCTGGRNHLSPNRWTLLFYLRPYVISPHAVLF